MKLKNKVAMLRRLYPKRSADGQLYRTLAETRGAFNRVRLWTLFVSEEGEYLLRDHVFKKREHMTPKEWRSWFDRKLDDIESGSVLPGIRRRTGLVKEWAVAEYLGWSRDVEHKPRNSAPRRARHSAKR